MAADEMLTRPPRRSLPAPPIGGWPRDGESPRAFNQRARREQRERREAAAETEGHEYSRACGCNGCAVYGAVQAHAAAARLAPRVSRADFKVFDEGTWGANRRGGTP